MGEKLTDREMEALDRCYREAAGKGWEPRGGTDTPAIRKFVAAGFLRVTDGRSGFERIKDCMVTWTDAGRQVMSSRTTIASLSEALAEAEKKGAEYAASLTAAHIQISALKAERDAADNALVDLYRDPKTGSFKFPTDVAAIVRRLDAAEADNAELREHIASNAVQLAFSNNDRIDLARVRTELERADVALRWYAENVQGFRRPGSVGALYGGLLDADGGQRARDAMNAVAPPRDLSQGDQTKAELGTAPESQISVPEFGQARDGGQHG